MSNNYKTILTNVLLALISGLILFVFERNITDILYSNRSFAFFLIIIIFIIILLLNGLIKEHKDKQEIYNQKSWFYYLVNGLVFAPLVSSIFILLEKSYLNYFIIYRHHYSFITSQYKGEAILIILVNILIFVCLLLFFYKIIFLEDGNGNIKKKYKRFASGSVGIKQDGLGFLDSIDNAAKEIKSLDNFVNVVTIDGIYGSGKSSFVRMIIENIDKNDKFLYSYLSLTETNETKDFSKLFTDRWQETLNERYPIINISLVSPLLKTILQETGNGFLAGIVSFVSSFNFCSSRTKNKINGEDLSKDISLMFGGIEEIKEDYWIFVIDELDRAKLSEIYRTIEVIERFKLNSLNGFPVKIIFILCFSSREMKKFFDKFENNEELAYLLKTFLISDKKSVDLPLFVPPTEYNVKRNYVINLFYQISKRNNLEISQLINKDLYLGNFEYISGFNEKESEVIGPVISLLVNETPRTIKRIETELILTLNNKQNYRFTDILLMSYVKVKLTFLIDFFKETLDLVIGHDDKGTSLPAMQSYLRFKNYREKKMSLINYIETQLELPEKEKTELTLNKDKVEKIMHLIGARYYDLLNNDNPVNPLKYLASKSLSYPVFMRDYLRLSQNTNDWRLKYNEIYILHQSGKMPNLGITELLEYADFVMESPRNLKIVKDILLLISESILNEKVEKKLCTTGETIYQQSIYKVIFLALNLINTSSDSSSEPDKNIKYAYNIIKEILKSDKVNVVAKYSILNSFINDQRGSGSEIHFELSRAYAKLDKYFKTELISIIQTVMSEYLKYLDKDIYKYEENFFYVLFQSWSGDTNDKEGISIIRKIASKNLVNNQDALILYWGQYSYEEEYDDHVNDFPEYISHQYDFPAFDHPGLYLPLKDLCEITSKSKVPQVIENKFSFWNKIVRKYPEWCEKKFEIIPESTLMSVLATKGLINKKE